jgi:recombinational DNA repair ATPase RecF
MYPRRIYLDDDNLKKYYLAKSEGVEIGRKISGEVDDIEKSLTEVEKKLINEEQKVDVSEFDRKLEDKTHEMGNLLLQYQKIEKERNQYVKDQTPHAQGLRDEYDSLIVKKEEKQRQLNKTGHKVQKAKDKLIPKIRKLTAPHLENEFEDFGNSEIDSDGRIYVDIFNHLEDWKEQFRKTK